MSKVLNFGCRLNNFEGKKIEELLVNNNENMIVINSCAVTNETERQVRQTIRKIKKDLNKAITKVRNAKDPSQLDMLKTQLDRLNALGGFKSIIPSEGVTFVYKGKLYKYTGAFAPVNQILGLLRF